MLRVRVLSLLTVFIGLGILSAHQKIEEHILELGSVLFIIALWYMSGASINDLSDIEIDKINLKNAKSRPLANNKTSVKQIYILAIISGIASLIGASFLGIRPFILIAIGIVLNWIYSMPPIRISSRGILAPLMLPIGYVVIPFLLGHYTIVGNFDADSILIIIALYLSFIGRIVLKDFRDIKGDTKFNKRTYIVRYGIKSTIIFSKVFWTLGTAISLRVFTSYSYVLSSAIILALMLIFKYLNALASTSSSLKQQAYISSVATTSTTILLAMMAVLHFNLNDQGPSQFMQNIFILGLIAYGFMKAHQTYKNPENIKLSF